MQLLSLALLVALPLTTHISAREAVMMKKQESCHTASTEVHHKEAKKTIHKEHKFAKVDGLVHVSSEAELEAALAEHNASNYVLDFSTSWCSFCKIIAGPYQELAQDPANANILFIKVDATGQKGSELAHKHKVRGYPTFEFYQKGKMVSSFPGGNEELLRNEVAKLQSSVQRGVTMPGVVTVTKEREEKKPSLAQVMHEEAKIEQEEATLATDIKALKKEKKVKKNHKVATSNAVQAVSSTKEHAALVAHADKPVITKVYSKTCKHCQKIAEPFKQHAAAHAGEAIFAEIEAKQLDDSFRKQYSIMGFPTFLAFEDGRLVASQIGADLDDLDAFIKKHATHPMQIN